MTTTFRPEDFFDLASFEHVALFEGEENVWEVLGTRLKDYISSVLEPGIHGRVIEGAFLEDKDSIHIGEGTVVEPGAYIKGPTIIGRNTQVRHCAYIRGNVIVGDKCVVGHTTEVKGAVMLNGSQAGHFAYIGDSILGNRVNLGAGTKLANLKIVEGNVRVVVDGVKVDTGLRKFGAVIGDDSQLGCNSVTSPGTILGKGCLVYPCVSVRGILNARTIIRVKAQIDVSERASRS
jgi:NDP-sugar pyrophosphorylase family protein